MTWRALRFGGRSDVICGQVGTDRETYRCRFSQALCQRIQTRLGGPAISARRNDLLHFWTWQGQMRQTFNRFTFGPSRLCLPPLPVCKAEFFS